MSMPTLDDARQSLLAKVAPRKHVYKVLCICAKKKPEEEEEEEI